MAGYSRIATSRAVEMENRKEGEGGGDGGEEGGGSEVTLKD